MSTYTEFLSGKARDDVPTGHEPGDLNSALFPFQRDIVRWAVRRGRAAIWADCGLGKTLMQLEWAREVPGNVLILAPLAVAEQTAREGEKFGIPVTVCRSQSDVVEGVNVTNYEMLQHFDPESFEGVVLDESSILKAYTGKTRTAIIDAFAATPYKLSCTATPAPNDVVELGNQAEFIGVMTRTEMLAMFFIHDGGSTQDWRLKGHGIKRFWDWVGDWAVAIRAPSDLGYDDVGFILPPLTMYEHVVDVDQNLAHGDLFDHAPKSMIERRQARRDSVNHRVAATADLVNSEPGAWVLWCDLNAESGALTAAIPDAVEIRGSDTVEHKRDSMLGFERGEIRVLVTKPSIAGFGMNWQHCSNVAFVGMSDSYESVYQAIRRCWRFGQHNEVTVHVVTASTEGVVRDNIRRKESNAQDMTRQIVADMRNKVMANVRGTERDTATYTESEASGNGWDMRLGDCVEVLRATEDDSIDFSVYSPPFSSLYTYSNSDRDMGNCANHAEFFEHFGFLAPELRRVTKPGRLMSFHCMNLPTSKARDGVIGITDFRGQLIRMFSEAGWIYHSEVCIWKDPVTAMQRTKALGLLHKQIKKDSCMSRQGIADYMVTMRKPGDNPERVEHTNESFPVAEWQQLASPIWTDINPSDTLQFRTAREDDDERHICPLQLEVIRRALRLWTNPGDLVLSPFAGIGSEGFVAIEQGRRFMGIELKQSYFNAACKNLADAEVLACQETLFA